MRLAFSMQQEEQAMRLHSAKRKELPMKKRLVLMPVVTALAVACRRRPKSGRQRQAEATRAAELQRAESVRPILMANGVSPGRIESEGSGKTRPVASNATSAGKAQNRRVEIVLQGGAAAP